MAYQFMCDTGQQNYYYLLACAASSASEALQKTMELISYVMSQQFSLPVLPDVFMTDSCIDFRWVKPKEC